MSIFSDTAEALELSPDGRDRAWLLLHDADLSPDDPAVVQLLIAESSRETMESHVAAMRAATSQAIAEFKQTQATAESAALARLTSSTGDIAKSVSTNIAAAVERAVVEASRERRDNAGVKVALVFGGGILVGVYLGSFGDLPDAGSATSWLGQFRPWQLLATGVMAFIVLRLICAWFVGAPLIRWLLALPARDDLSSAWPRSRHNHY
ncbi:hypothetical protein HLH33_00565 [Gluconacetobacter diazotrophicus]|uniref:Uncharacterized protein n=1 Tax=Gluconacetobacter diazotrophicus TaxID=33996 RepID=A0A7W4FBT9_GLUDI|nr:hypothetical protein [Gluconacetobacter diazotrophicus]MBB2154813.1 hypothetical protein [Gluconacetobacter diazotrophicus]